jgi:hypothetical protein
MALLISLTVFPPLSILIADDHEVVRRGIRALRSHDNAEGKGGRSRYRRRVEEETEAGGGDPGDRERFDDAVVGPDPKAGAPHPCRKPA